MEVAELEILKNVQQFYFPEEIESLSKSENDAHVKKSSCLRSLDPVLVNGVLRVGGRLSLPSTTFEAKHQIILPKNDHVTNLIVEHYYLISVLFSDLRSQSGTREVLNHQCQFHC